MFNGICAFKKNEDTKIHLSVKVLVEFLGTYFFVHTIVFSVNFGQTLAPLAIGSILMVCVNTWGHVSGAHFNPAVSTAFWVAGKIGPLQWLFYVITQLTSGIISGLIAVMLCVNRDESAFASISFEGKTVGFYTEFMWTFLLSSVVLNTAATCSSAYQRNSFFGLTIGFTVFTGAVAVGEFSGGAFNPAIATGLNVGKIPVAGYEFSFKDLFTALISEFLGGVVAGTMFMVTESIEVETPPTKTYEVCKPAEVKRIINN